VPRAASPTAKSSAVAGSGIGTAVSRMENEGIENEATNCADATIV
jgi:hypothetical protein